MTAENNEAGSMPAHPESSTPESVSPESAAPESATLESVTPADRAAHQALTAKLMRQAALRWLTHDQVTVLGQQVVASIDRYQRRHRRPPTWADALASVDPPLLAPLHDVPDEYPFRAAFWRRELRQQLMLELKRTRWITYTRTPRSLHPGERGRGWLTITRQDADYEAVTRPMPSPSTLPPQPPSAI